MTMADKVHKKHRDSHSEPIPGGGSNNLNPDIRLRCGQKEFPVEQSLLQKGSTYFQSLFSAGEMVKLENGRIQLDEVKPEALAVVLDFMKTGSLEKIYAVDDFELIKSVLSAANFLGVPSLYKHCWSALECMLTENYFFELLMIGYSYKEMKYVDKIIRFLAQKFARICQAPDFLLLTTVQLQQLLQHSELKATSDCLLLNLIAWAQEDSFVRSFELLKLVSLIDLQEASNSVLGSMLQSEVVKKNQDLFNLLIPMCSIRLLQSETTVLAGNNLVCFRKCEDFDIVTTYNIQDETWTTTNKVPIILDEAMAFIPHKNNIYITGLAASGEELVPIVYQYNPAQNAITDSGFLIHAVCGPGAAILKDEIYILGGCKNCSFYEPSHVVQKYNPETRQTEELSPLRINSFHPTVVSTGNYLFAITQLSVQQYELLQDQWTTVKSLENTSALGVVWDAKLYILTKSKYIFEIFDPISQTWEMNEIPDGGPKNIIKLWSCHGSKKLSGFILFRDESMSLHCYKPCNRSWEKCVHSDCVDDRCLSGRDVLL